MFRKGSHKSQEYFGSQHRFEHWYRDNTVYFITARCRNKTHADAGHQNYFDGCIRDAMQCERAYRYTLTQCRRHGICETPTDYPHTHQLIEVHRAIKRATDIKAFLNNVPYKRYHGK